MTRLKVALQKTGRLSEQSLELLKTCGITFQNGLGKLKAEAQNFPLDVYFLRDDDIPQYVADAVADVGIVGENVRHESGLKDQTEVVAALGFGGCRLSLAVPKGCAYNAPPDLAGKRIATSYPRILGEFLAAQKVTAEIHVISGAVEIAPGIGLADAICDIVSSGSTLFTNGLQEVETVFRSEAVLVVRKDLPEAQQELLNKLCFRIEAVKAARNNKYILLNAPNAKLDTIIALLPGIKSPTVMPLAIDGWSSVHSVINENDFWENIEKLTAAGAEGVLVLPINQMIK